MGLIVGFIGGGNMAEAMISGLSQHQPDTLIRVVEPNPLQAERLMQRFSVQVVSGPTALADCQMVVLAVKPQVVTTVLPTFQLGHGTLAISIAAGIPLSVLSALQPHVAWVRSMPNTPALVGKGMTGAYATTEVLPALRQQAEVLLSSFGHCVWVREEGDLDAVTALSGSGPAYFFRMVESLRQAGERLGLSPEVAAQLALQTFSGAAALATASPEDVGVLRAKVTSKGGTTEAALAVFDSGLDALVLQALSAAHHRSRELAAASQSAFTES